MFPCSLRIPLPLFLAVPALAQCEVDRLQPAQGSPGGEFGSHIAMDGDWAAIAGRSHDDDRGAVWMFERVGGQWVERQLLQGDDTDSGDSFGYEVALEGDRLVASAIGHDEPNGFDSGAVYAFQLEVGVWNQIQKITPAQGNSQDAFGDGLDMEGSHLLIGSSGSDLFSGQGGAVFVYDWNGSQFTETDVLSPTLSEFGFGWKVDLSGERALITCGSVSTDRVYVFEFDGTGWIEVDALSVPGSYSWWGRQVALDGDTALVVSSVASSGDAQVFAFEHDGSSWNHTDTLHPLPGADGFATNLRLDGERAWFGAFAEDELGMTTGAVHQYRRDGGEWHFAGKWVDVLATGFEGVGFFVEIQGGTALVGAPRLFSGAGEGKVHVLDLAHSSSFQYCYCEDAQSTCGNEDLAGGCENSTGLGGRLAFCGSASVAADDSRLVASNLRPGAFGILFMGGGTNLSPLGGGLRCTSGGMVGQYRYPATMADPAGILTLDPGFVAFSQDQFPVSGQIAVGDTWYFQCWYRDPTGPCGSVFNLTNAVAVTFQP